VSAGFSPGPWEVSLRNPNNFSVFQSHGMRVAYTAISQRSNHAAEGLANARLIAAAPELYEALEDAGTTFRIMAETAEELMMEGAPKLREQEAAINATLAKARGETA
jgi:hypothetical protein